MLLLDKTRIDYLDHQEIFQRSFTNSMILAIQNKVLMNSYPLKLKSVLIHQESFLILPDFEIQIESSICIGIKDES